MSPGVLMLKRLHLGKWPIAAAVAGVATAIAVAAATGAFDSQEMGGQLPALDVPQNAMASDQGIVLRAEAAAFSGTSTHVRFAFDLSGLDKTRVSNVRELALPEEGARQSTLFPAGGSPWFPVSGDLGGTVTIRLAPLRDAIPPSLALTAIDLKLSGGEVVRINGSWRLDLRLPSDLAARLRTEELRAAASASDKGISVPVISGLRSTTETLVTVAIGDGDAVSQLGQPIMVADGKNLIGAEAERKEQGRVVVYTFPPTEFGDEVKLRLGPFVRPSLDTSSFTDVNLGAVIARQHPRPRSEDSVAISASDITLPASGETPVISFKFSQSTLVGEDSATIVVQLAGNYEQQTDQLAMVGADGRELRRGYVISSYRKDPSGAITAGTTDVEFRYDDFRQLDGIVRVVHGAGQTIIRGDWTISLRPR